MNGSILVTIRDGRVEMFLDCTHREQEALEHIMAEIRRVVEEGLELVGVEGLLVSVE